MPAKGKKSSSRSSPASSAVSGGASPITPRTQSRTPSQGSSRSGGGRNDDDADLYGRIAAEAAAKFPMLMEPTAFCGRVSETEALPAKGNRATVWLSEAAMVSSSLVPGSLVSVSLATLDITTIHKFPLDNLAERCATYFGFDIDDHMTSIPGNYFAIASVFPSRKVLKNEVRLSWGLSCTTGFPDAGKVVFVSPTENLPALQHLKDGQSEDLYLNTFPLKVGLTSCNEGLTTNNSMVHLSKNNRNIASDSTVMQQEKISIPAISTMHSKNSHGTVSSSSSGFDASVVKVSLEDEKVRQVLEVYAARWLYGRHLLKGNFVAVPICGQICAFLVENAGFGSSQHLRSEKYDLFAKEDRVSLSSYQFDGIIMVDTKTKVHLSNATSSKLEISQVEKDVRSEDVLEKKCGPAPKLGGLSKEFAALKEIVSFSLMSTSALPRYKGVLLYGPPGTGKTSLASLCAHDAGASLFSINGPEIISQYYGESEQALYKVFDSARQAVPSVVFIDELDAIAPARKEGGEELSLRMVATLLKLMDEIKKIDRLLIIAATNRPDSIDSALRRPGRFDREIEIGVPSPEQRLDILQTLLTGIDHSLSDKEIHSLAVTTHGFVGADLAALCNEAAMIALRRYIKQDHSHQSGLHLEKHCRLDKTLNDMEGIEIQKSKEVPSIKQIDSLTSLLSSLAMPSQGDSLIGFQRSQESSGTSHDIVYGTEESQEMPLKVTIEDLKIAKMKVRPSAMREVMLELPEVHWEDVGGQTEVKRQLIEAVQLPQLCPDAFSRIGIRPPRGLLMIGPPGCSKTLMARAVASETKLNFLAVKGPELFSKWVGESEKAVKALFAKARTNSPAIIFFDEIDGLAVTRGHENDGTSVSDRVLSQLLQEMDGLEQRTGVTVIAATNRPDKIDPALLRPGRFDRLLDVQPPDEGDRQDIFSIHMRNMPCSSNVNIKELAKLTDGYTGADIKLICREAAIAALEENLEISEISMEHFNIGINRVKPADAQFYRELATQFRRLVNGEKIKDG